MNNLFVMDFGYWKTQFISCLCALVISHAWSTELRAPEHINVKSSVLSWEPSRDVNNVTYTVEYSMRPWEKWNYLCGCNQTMYRFGDEDFYGKKFRIRAERANQTTAWQRSDMIQCKHTDTCAPQINLTKNSMVLWMHDKDKTLKEVFGGHLAYRALYWKESSTAYKQELVANGNTLRIEGLESGQKYCFQVVYMLYNKPYGNPSRVLCEVIPETPSVRIIISGMLTFVGLLVFGCCLYFVSKNYKSIKTFLQPPLDIPNHIEEFFSGEFPHHEFIHISSQDLESSDLVTLVSEQNGEEEQSRHD